LTAGSQSFAWRVIEGYLDSHGDEGVSATGLKGSITVRC
jgi:hypothetical protein